MSYKLRVVDKDRIINLIQEETFKIRKENLKNEQTKLADTIYDFLYGKYKKNIDQLPINMFKLYNRITINTGIDEKGYSRPNIYLSYENDEGRPMSDNYLSLKDMPLPIQSKLTAYKKKQDKYQEDCDKIRAEIKAVVYGVTTLDKLIEVWPESEKHIKGMGFEDNATKFFLKVNPDDLNKHISEAAKISNG